MAFGEPQPEEEHDPQFAPVHQLTDKDQIETKTHEEDEDVQFKMRAKLFRFDSSTNEWKERGTGDVRILAHKVHKKVRLVMRRDKTLKVCANHYITSDMRLQPNIGSDRSWVWKVAADVSEGTPTAETLAIRFANSDNAGQFKVAFEAGQRTNAEIVSQAPPATQPTPDAATGATELAPQPTPTEAPTQDTETRVEETALASSAEAKGAEEPLAGSEATKETAETSETSPEGAPTETPATEAQ
ncbi:hypothetical protein BS47DRAFT_1349183 [Hydnum rufescens UP504]|uniref:RanBD1 domain-containing protein n=1 Tax=Hydnum rufescens UP504 TaxID=1448309 RepID=A0A9P6APH4_9AGAM|nr:hypothetical protein BS47DRAFT_1349183 [Hydnum rufescens UP504]